MDLGLTVGYLDHGTVRQQRGDGRVEPARADRVQVSGGLVEQQQWRVAQERARERDLLALSRGQAEPAFPHLGGVAAGQALDELGRSRGLRGTRDGCAARCGRRIDLYADARDGTSSHFLAVRLTPAIRTAPRAMDITLYTRTGETFTATPDIALPALREQLAALAGQNMCLAINLNGPVGEAGFTGPVQRSALTEDATAVIVIALPPPPGQPDASRRELAPTLEDFESTIAAILTVADQVPASTGLLYFKTPAVIPVALGHYLRAGNWIPMRHCKTTPVTYQRFPEPSTR